MSALKATPQFPRRLPVVQGEGQGFSAARGAGRGWGQGGGGHWCSWYTQRAYNLAGEADSFRSEDDAEQGSAHDVWPEGDCQLSGGP